MGNISILKEYALVPNLKDLFYYDFEYIITAYIVIPVSIIVLISNTLLLFLFWKKRLRTSIHIFVAAISVSETIFVLTQSFFATYFLYIFNITGFIPHQHCLMFALTFNILPEIFRSHSIFLTVALATQRCVCVTHPLTISRIFTRKRTVLIVVGLFILSGLFKVYDMTFIQHRERQHISWLPSNNRIPNNTCILGPPDWTKDYIKSVFAVQTILWISCVNVIPCIWLLVAGLILICGLRRASKWRRKATVLQLKQQIAQESKERKLTVLSVWIIGVFLLFQIPYYITDTLTDYPWVFFARSKDTIRMLLAARSLTGLCVNLTLPSNFIIYIVCYKEYYDYLKSIFICKRSDDKLMRAHSTTPP